MDPVVRLHPTLTQHKAWACHRNTLRPCSRCGAGKLNQAGSKSGGAQCGGMQGIVGNLASGKSALVHRYLTGTYVQEESPEGGRFKKEIVVDGQSYLLLIRDEGGPPEAQFAMWVDAVIFVFSLEDEISFQTVYHYYSRMANYRNTSEIPMVLVGTQDAINSNNPRVIDDARARKLSNDLKRCTYYETCATYGLNVERVFQDAIRVELSLSGMSILPARLAGNDRSSGGRFIASSLDTIKQPPSTLPLTPVLQRCERRRTPVR
ncbi:Arf-GAP with GTPase, ANK repeat and PH domain-containing protein 1 [Chelonia mydas]|uniref:Arf-GAP with GTPase, ANK repeat and PH domain-containing protein 1 n=1 Tax=Chelonia mydas TaxID=8469 RepID=M7BZ58_CHEMY|nr:Arf-GAP with GTPase, ANK repeat and PH domain-containing protein 1 [Chelonia mydas]